MLKVKDQFFATMTGCISRLGHPPLSIISFIVCTQTTALVKALSLLIKMDAHFLRNTPLLTMANGALGIGLSPMMNDSLQSYQVTNTSTVQPQIPFIIEFLNSISPMKMNGFA
jgi:hypothetical protein